MPGLRSPFLPPDELHPDRTKKDKKKKEDQGREEGRSRREEEESNKKRTKRKTERRRHEKKDEKKPPEVKIDFNDLASRLSEVPAPAGNYDNLQAAEKRLCWLNAERRWRRAHCVAMSRIANKGDEPDTVMAT